jgi:hypothetical protein
LKESDRLVRLNDGLMPVEAEFPDWAVILGYALYLLIRSNGQVQFIFATLDVPLRESIRAINRRGSASLYRFANGRLTPFGRHLALLFIERNVSTAAIMRELQVTKYVVDRLRAIGPA